LLRVEGMEISLPANPPDPVDSVIAVDCAGEPRADNRRLLVSNEGTDTLRAMDAVLEGGLKYGPGKSRDAWVFNWKGKEDGVYWPVRTDQKVTYDVALVYDATEGVKGRVVEGDAGKEKAKEQAGDGGTYSVSCGDWSVEKPVRTGVNVTESLGRFSMSPGDQEIRIRAVNVTGEELFRLRALELTPVKTP